LIAPSVLLIFHNHHSHPYAFQIWNNSVVPCIYPSVRLLNVWSKLLLVGLDSIDDNNPQDQNSCFQQVYDVWCEFHQNYGYAFVSNLSHVDINIDDLYTNRSHIILRHITSSGVQKEIKVEQLSQYHGYCHNSWKCSHGRQHDILGCFCYLLVKPEENRDICMALIVHDFVVLRSHHACCRRMIMVECDTAITVQLWFPFEHQMT
jgi:hypothetical protein